MVINPKKTFVNEGMMSDKYIKKTKEKIDYSLDKAIESNDKKAVEDIREKCIKAIRHVEATKNMRTVDHYFDLPEWILRFLLYCIGIIWIKIDLRGKTKFTEEEILKIEKELKDALKKCNKFLKIEEVKKESVIVHSSKNPLIINEGFKDIVNKVKDNLPGKQSKPFTTEELLRQGVAVTPLNTIDIKFNSITEEKMKRDSEELYSKYSKAFSDAHGEDAMKDPKAQKYISQLVKQDVLKKYMNSKNK